MRFVLSEPLPYLPKSVVLPRYLLRHETPTTARLLVVMRSPDVHRRRWEWLRQKDWDGAARSRMCPCRPWTSPSHKSDHFLFYTHAAVVLIIFPPLPWRAWVPHLAESRK